MTKKPLTVYSFTAVIFMIGHPDKGKITVHVNGLGRTKRAAKQDALRQARAVLKCGLTVGVIE